MASLCVGFGAEERRTICQMPPTCSNHLCQLVLRYSMPLVYSSAPLLWIDSAKRWAALMEPRVCRTQLSHQSSFWDLFRSAMFGNQCHCTQHQDQILRKTKFILDLALFLHRGESGKSGNMILQLFEATVVRELARCGACTIRAGNKVSRSGAVVGPSLHGRCW